MVGADDKLPAEKPRHTVEVSTYYIDQREVTNGAYAACEASGFCPKRDLVMPLYEPFLADDLPAIPISYSRARKYCTWVGKRLPTEAEWEKAARGGAEARTYPWGEEPATCDRAQLQGCAPLTTKPVGSFAAGAYGLFDMAGNGYEWVNDWASDCYDGCPKACGAACTGPDPAGPCGGAPDCAGHTRRVVRGGSWFWGADQARGSARRAEPPEQHHRLGFRCASSRPLLATRPPLAPTAHYAAPAPPKPPTDVELAAFRAVVQDDDILKLPTCDRKDRTADCRDPKSYIVSNEFEQHLWEPYLRNVGGGFAGVGSDQGFSFVAAAKSEWVWLFDYDPAIVRLHAVLKAFIVASPTRADFVALFDKARDADVRALLERAFSDAPGEQKLALDLLRNARPVLEARYKAGMAESKVDGTFGWLRTDEAYQWIRALHQQGRIQSIKGNLLTDKAVPSIARSAKKLGVPIRVYYPSNADDLWELTQRYRDNVLALPMDDRSVTIRTIYQRGERKKAGEPEWVYFVHGGLAEQEKLRRGYKLIAALMEDAFPTEHRALRVAWLPGRPTGPSPAARP